MKRLNALVAIVCAITACGDAAGPENSLPSELAGSWSAHPGCSPACEFTLVDATDPNAHVDLVATAGLTLTLTMNRNGNASLTIFGQSQSGRAKVDNGLLILEAGGTPDTIAYTVNGATLDLQFRTPLSFVDFDGDLILDPSYAHGVLKKK